MNFVVGLGNPGKKYDATRHNVGFEVIDDLATRHRFGPSKVFKKAEISRGRISGKDVLLIRPLTFMNLSGEAVGPVVRYYRGECEDMVVVHDELDFEPGAVKLKKGGGHGGHNGLKSIAEHMGKDFTRIRLGVGKPPPGRGANHVLGRFCAEDRILVNEAIVRSSDAVESLFNRGLALTMGDYNQNNISSSQ
jgi:peptidyl-tRNA hydrolase, PTH1 family